MMKYIAKVSKILLLVSLFGPISVQAMEGEEEGLRFSVKNVEGQEFRFFYPWSQLKGLTYADLRRTINKRFKKIGTPGYIDKFVFMEVDQTDAVDNEQNKINTGNVAIHQAYVRPPHLNPQPQAPEPPTPEEKFQAPEEEDEPTPKTSFFRPGKKTLVGGGIVAGVVATGLAIYAGLSYYKKRQIKRVVAKYDLTIDQFSPQQKDMLGAAVNASYGIPGSMTNLKRLIAAGPLASAEVNEQTMLKILAALYYKKDATDEDVALLKELLAQQAPTGA